MSNIIRSLNLVIQQIERSFPVLFGKLPPSDFGILSVEPVHDLGNSSSTFSLKDLIGDGFLWAVPKHRRTVEKRLNRKFGNPRYHWKMLVPKSYLRICINCGNNHENDTLCPHCYDKVRKETELIKEKIERELKLDPVESEVVVLYDGEKAACPEEFWKGKRIVEMEKPRPSWFSKNLLQKSTQTNSDSTTVSKTDVIS